jgi:hypothetical protein
MPVGRSRIGTVLNGLFTIVPSGRYTGAMLLFALAAATAASVPPTPPPPPTQGAVLQARASVRILSGARVTAERQPETAIVSKTTLSGADGRGRPALLVEFP